MKVFFLPVLWSSTCAFAIAGSGVDYGVPDILSETDMDRFVQFRPPANEDPCGPPMALPMSCSGRTLLGDTRAPKIVIHYESHLSPQEIEHSISLFENANKGKSVLLLESIPRQSNRASIAHRIQALGRESLTHRNVYGAESSGHINLSQMFLLQIQIKNSAQDVFHLRNGPSGSSVAAQRGFDSLAKNVCKFLVQNTEFRNVIQQSTSELSNSTRIRRLLAGMHQIRGSDSSGIQFCRNVTMQSFDGLPAEPSMANRIYCRVNFCPAGQRSIPASDSPTNPNSTHFPFLARVQYLVDRGMSRLNFEGVEAKDWIQKEMARSGSFLDIGLQAPVRNEMLCGRNRRMAQSILDEVCNIRSPDENPINIVVGYKHARGIQDLVIRSLQNSKFSLANLRTENAKSGSSGHGESENPRPTEASP